MSTFLNASELADLTGVRIGKEGKTREQRQVAELKRMKIPHYTNARGCPVVAKTEKKRDERVMMYLQKVVPWLRRGPLPCRGNPLG